MSSVQRSRAIVLAAVLISALLLTLSSPAGTFTIDDSNYLSTLVALKGGSFGLPGTATEPASPEWYTFDPFPPFRGPPTVPVMPTAPPFWAPFALIFSPFGLRGFIFLNALCFALTVVLVHRLTAMHAKSATGPALAAAVFALGSFSFEYAQGIWPHMLSVALVTFALYSAARARLTTSIAWAAVAGVSAGLAAGVRYQNVVIAAAVGLGLLLFSRAKVRLAAGYALGVLTMLGIAAWMNLHRLGIFNPITKGHGYASVSSAAPPTNVDRAWDIVLSFWTRVVDFSVHPAIHEPSGYVWAADPDLGAFLTTGAVKKALLQSAPWVIIGWLLLAGAFLGAKSEQPKRDDARSFALMVGMVLGMFALVGTSAHDGLCFNARYLLELIPCAAVAIGWWAEEHELVRRSWIRGGLAGALMCLPVGLAEPYSLLRTVWIRFAPLALCTILLGAFALKRTRAVQALLATSVVWALGVHLIDDLPASHQLRGSNASRLAEVRAVVPDRCALFVYGRARDALWPLAELSHCHVLDPGKDAGRDAAMLVQVMIREGRRVFVDSAPFPQDMLEWMISASGTTAKPAGEGLLELVPRS